MAEASICGSATVNGYRRRQPSPFCPSHTAWGLANRTVGLRVIKGSESATRIEKRDAGADANPYLLLAADIAAGLDGIENSIEPDECELGNAYESQRAAPIPTDLSTAIDLARRSAWLKDVMGETQWEIYLQMCERELDFYNEFINNQVTQIEIDRYMGNF